MSIISLISILMFILPRADAAHGIAPGKKIRFAFPSSGTLISLQVGLVLQRTDILKKHGIDAEITPMALGTELKTALASNKVDAIFTSESNFIVLLGQGFECQAFASLGSGGKMALVVNADSPVKDVKDLKGKKLATIFGTSLHQPAVDWVKAAGLKPGKDVSILNLASVGAMRAALAQKEIDAIISLDPFLLEALEKTQVRVLKETDIDLIALATNEFAKGHPETLRSFKAAVAEAALYFATHKEEVNGWAATVSKISPEILDRASRANRNYQAKKAADVDLSVSRPFRRKLKRLADFLFEEKLIQSKVNPEESIRDL